MKRSLLSLLLLFLLSAQVYSQICGYGYRKRITIDPARVSGGSDFTDFPVLINITADTELETVANGGRVTNANGYDIAFTAADGYTVLSHSIQKYTATTGEFVAYVKVPALSTTYNTYLYIYYGNASVVTNPSSTNTWDSNFEGVYYLHSDYNDKTANGNNGTNNGTTFTAVQVANGAEYATTNTRYIQAGTTGMSATSGTVELWGRPASFLASETYYYGHTTQAAYQNRIQIYNIQNGGGTNVLRLGMGGSHSVAGDIMTMVANTLYHIVLTWNSGTYVIYVNGVQRSTGAYAGLTTLQTYADIGNDGNPGQRTEALRGRIDDVKTSSIARSSDWVITAYNNQSSPSTFYSISAVQPRWIGGTSTNWGTAANWSPAAVPAADADVIITNGTNQPTLDANRQIGAMWIQTGATVNLSSFNLSFRYDITNCGTMTGSTGTVTANSTTQAQSEYFSGSGTFNLNHLTINNTFAASPAVRLMKDVNVSGTLTLTSGITYTTTTNILALSNTAASTSGSAASFVSGPMSKDGATDFIYPVGKGTLWRRLATNGISAASTFRVEYFNTAYTSTTPVTAPLNNVSLLEYWQLDQTVGAGTATIVLYWEDASVSGINDCTDLTMGRWTGATWVEQPATAAGTCSGAGTGTATSNAAVASASFNRPFTFASKTPSPVNVLPIELLNFEAVMNNTVVDLDWTTATETNNDFFTIERTRDGKDFEPVAVVNGSGTTSQPHSYATKDMKPYDGVSYYRLRQTDFNGKFSYSPLRAVEQGRALSFILYPNPASPSDKVSINLSGVAKGSEVQLKVFDVTGRQSICKTLVDGASSNVFDLELSELSAGVYFVTAVSGDKSYRQKLVVK